MDSNIEKKAARSIRILVVDMSAIARKLTCTMLKREGFETMEAPGGKEALEILSKEYYHVVITGFQLEDMDGVDFCRAIRQVDSFRYTYIIVLSGQGTIPKITQALDNGADEFMKKPLMKPLLMARLKLAERIIDLEEKIKLIKLQSEDLLSRDALTEVYNRRRIQNDLPKEIKRASRSKNPLAVLICDLDKFKSINDTYGHLAGDRVLKQVAQRLKDNCREDIDWVARYGGEEFVVVLPETDAEKAAGLAERMRKAIAAEPFDTGEGERLNVTMSFGVAGLDGSNARGMTAELVLDKADACLYNAKHSGRNRVCLEELSHEPGLN